MADMFVSLAFTAWVEVAGTRHPLAAFEVTYAMGIITSAQCAFAVGFAADGSGKTERGQSVARGTKAVLKMKVEQDVTDPLSGRELLREGVHVLLDGYVDDSGPMTLSFGTFNAGMQILGKTAVLNTGILNNAPFVPRNATDVSLPVAGLTSARGASVSEVSNVITNESLNGDVWSGMQKFLLGVAKPSQGTTFSAGSSQLAVQMRRFFGSMQSTVVYDALNAMVGKLVPGYDTRLNICVASYLTSRLTWERGQSHFNRFVELGHSLMFRLVEHPLGVGIIPWTPFVPSADHVPITASTADGLAWTNRDPDSLGGMAFVRQGTQGGGVNSPDTLGGAYKRPAAGDNPLGIVITEMLPPFFSQWNILNPNPNVAKTAITALDAAMNADGDSTGNKYARYRCLEQATVGRATMVNGPLRMDIGLATAVKIQPPSLGGLLGPPVYGQVQRVTLSADARSGKARSVLEVGFVRSEALQQAEIDNGSPKGHPLWSNAYVAGRLDEPLTVDG